RTLVREYLSSDESGKWLLVIDNADDPDLFLGSNGKAGIEEYLPESEYGLVLLTTRSRQVAVQFAQSNIVDIEEMEPEEATLLLQKALAQGQTPQDEALVEDLLIRLTYLPLAITQAAAYLNQTKVPIRKYLGLLRGAEKDAVRLLGREFRDSTRYQNSHNAIATTWIISFDQILKSDPFAVDLLSFIACIEPKAIPQWIMPGSESEETELAIGILCSFSFLVRRGDDDMFDMHSLVHMATREWIQKQDRQDRVAHNAIRRLQKIFPSHDSANRKLWRECMPHAIRLLHDTQASNTEERYKLVVSVGKCMDTDRRFKEAIRCFEEVEAIEMLEHVVAVQRETLDEKDYSRLTSEHELARAYLADRRIKEAIEMLEHVVAIEAQIYAEDDPERVLSVALLADAYIQLESCNENMDSKSPVSDGDDQGHNKDTTMSRHASIERLIKAMSSMQI
ncbi:uncharacterized protein B0I36DRAFT_254159, partial [Microdochium trichocladiopsis]